MFEMELGEFKANDNVVMLFEVACGGIKKTLNLICIFSLK